MNSCDEKTNRRTRLKIHRSIETTTLSDPVGAHMFDNVIKSLDYQDRFLWGIPHKKR